jgi:plastocyanin
MKKLTALLVGAVALLATTVALAATTDVEISKSGITPKDVTVEAGNALSFKNTDTVAHALVVDKTACDLTLQPQQASACTFATPGTFSYDDTTTKDANFSGKITVSPAVQRSVTLALNRNIAIFGDSVTLSGATSAKAANETVTVSIRPVGEPAMQVPVTTGANGAWSLRVQPRVRTEYQAQYGSAQSGKLVVVVRPRITFQKVGMNKYLVVVLANKSLAGSTVQLTRYVAGTGWAPLDVAQLATIARTDSLAVKTVTLNVARGTKLRALMSDDQTGPDYIDAHSNFVVN